VSAGGERIAGAMLAPKATAIAVCDRGAGKRPMGIA